MKEYKGDFLIALKEAKSWKDLNDGQEIKVIWARVETLTIDSLRHIRGGKIEKDDPLWVYLRKWLTLMEVVSTKALQQSLSKIKVGVC
ncbi:MAG: hypothetical protein Q7S44_04415 [bacterium]|nr:hypothetical protein [bacterium]